MFLIFFLYIDLLFNIIFGDQGFWFNCDIKHVSWHQHSTTPKSIISTNGKRCKACPASLVQKNIEVIYEKCQQTFGSVIKLPECLEIFMSCLKYFCSKHWRKHFLGNIASKLWSFIYWKWEIIFFIIKQKIEFFMFHFVS